MRNKGIDPIGYFSLRQNLFIISIGTTPAGLINIVKRCKEVIWHYKIGLIAVLPSYQNLELDNSLTEFAEKWRPQTKQGRYIAPCLIDAISADV